MDKWNLADKDLFVLQTDLLVCNQYLFDQLDWFVHRQGQPKLAAKKQ